MRIRTLSPEWFFRIYKWRCKINELLYAIATKADSTGWCLYCISRDNEEGFFVETMVHWYSNSRFELSRNSFKTIDNVVVIEDEEKEDKKDQTISSSIVAEEGYLIRRILINLNPDDFYISYHPSPDDSEEAEIEALVREEVEQYLLSDDDIEEEDDEEGDETVA